MAPTCSTRRRKRVFSILAKETILATGGLGSVFLHTTNPPGARGDGIAMAYRAGARCINMQYIQFHPTALLAPDGCFLISETVRGEGGRLVDRRGKEFMQRFHPAGSLAPRDIAARAIYQTMLESGEPCVYLDITHKPAEQLRERFPGIYAVCMEHGIDMTREPIPVVPAAHYSCGGIATDDYGQTTVDRSARRRRGRLHRPARREPPSQHFPAGMPGVGNARGRTSRRTNPARATVSIFLKSPTGATSMNRPIRR